MEIIEIIFYIVFTLLGFIGLVKWYSNSCNNPAYDAWLTEDKANYPKLYE